MPINVRPVSIRLHVVIEVLRKQFVGLRSHTNEVRSEDCHRAGVDKKGLARRRANSSDNKITGLKNLVSEHFGVACAVGDALPIDVSILDVRDSQEPRPNFLCRGTVGVPVLRTLDVVGKDSGDPARRQAGLSVGFRACFTGNREGPLAMPPLPRLACDRR